MILTIEIGNSTITLAAWRVMIFVSSAASTPTG